ncbi:MAG: DUF512 domain-containing protein [Coriobacteriales bacterium]|jgi:putative radical SAM enzyme (TIGR03279 family)|nr:DUF512 domain-containing protein [Coriobacteriales bacterium]
MRVETIEGRVPRDILDWLWLAGEERLRLTARAGAEDEAAAAANLPTSTSTHRPSKPTEHLLVRELGESWGITFFDPLFDGLITCRNRCLFCFMTMLPNGMRPALYLRDDDYRLSFLQGNFVTLTNLGEADLRRIIDYHLSPLHVSLHAISPELRQRLIGPLHGRGIDALEKLLDSGIEVHAQIVAVPGINDGNELDTTLAWIQQRPNILSAGIVPYGHTRLAHLQTSFSPDDARRVIARLEAWQESSRRSDGRTRFQLADEWYLLADLPLPPAAHYDDYPQLENGIGMLRCFEEDWKAARHTKDAKPGEPYGPFPPGAVLITGEAFAPVLRRLLAESAPPVSPPIEVRAIQNRFFGGNVNVTGLLTARDIIEQLREQGLPPQGTIVLPPSIFNPDGLTLDDLRLADLQQALAPCQVIISNM